MGNISTYLADKLLDHYLGGTAYTAPTPWLALFTTNPTMPAGTGGVEVSGGSYARVNISTLFSAAAAGSKTNNANVNFAQATASWGTVVGGGIYDASTGGNLLEAAALGTSVPVGSGDTFQVPSGDIVSTLA